MVFDSLYAFRWDNTGGVWAYHAFTNIWTALKHELVNLSCYKRGQQSLVNRNWICSRRFTIADIYEYFQRWMGSQHKINDVAGWKVQSWGCRIGKQTWKVTIRTKSEDSKATTRGWKLKQETEKQKVCSFRLHSSVQLEISEKFHQIFICENHVLPSTASKSISGEFKTSFWASFNEYENFPFIRIRFVNENLFPTWFDSCFHVSTLPHCQADSETPSAWSLNK